MNQNEISRLAVVEAKIDGLVLNNEKLKEFLVAQIEAQEKAISIGMLGQKEATSIAMVASEKAIVKAEIANDLRFSEMDKRINESVTAINVSIRTLAENQTLNTGVKTGITESKVDLTRYIGWIVSGLAILGFIISQVIR